MMKSLLYPLFGVLVLGGYYTVVSRGVDPFATASDVQRAPTGPDGRPARGGGGVFIYGGFHGGK